MCCPKACRSATWGVGLLSTSSRNVAASCRHMSLLALCSLLPSTSCTSCCSTKVGTFAAGWLRFLKVLFCTFRRTAGLEMERLPGSSTQEDGLVDGFSIDNMHPVLTWLIISGVCNARVLCVGHLAGAGWLLGCTMTMRFQGSRAAANSTHDSAGASPRPCQLCICH